MKNWSNWAGLLGVSLTTAVSVNAEVTWTQRQHEVRTEPGMQRVERSFAFTNEGEKAVMVTSIKSSCGCTTADLSKTVYAPGESGQVDVVFDLGDRKGKQIKKVVVRTDDPATPVTTLTLNVTIPKLVELSPRLLMWKADESREPKTMEVTLNSVEPIELKGVEVAGDERLKTEIEEVEPGKKYCVKVTPHVGSEAMRTIIWLRTDRDEELAEANGGERDPAWRFLVRVDGEARPGGSSPKPDQAVAAE